MDQVEATSLRRQEILELGFVGHERVACLVEARLESGSHQRLDLRTVVVGRREDLVTRKQPERMHAEKEAMPRAGEERYVRLRERELSGADRSAKMGRRRERRPDVESAAHLVVPAGPAMRGMRGVMVSAGSSTSVTGLSSLSAAGGERRSHRSLRHFVDH